MVIDTCDCEYSIMYEKNGSIKVADARVLSSYYRTLCKVCYGLDLESYVLKNKDTKNEMTGTEMCETARSFILAGADTTKLLLSATTFYLLRNPD